MFKAIKENREYRNTMEIIKGEMARNQKGTVIYLNYQTTVDRLREENFEVNYNGCGMFVINWK